MNEPLSDSFLNSTGLLSSKEITIIEEQLEWSQKIVKACHNFEDKDILVWHHSYVNKMFKRLMRGMVVNL